MATKQDFSGRWPCRQKEAVITRSSATPLTVIPADYAISLAQPAPGDRETLGPATHVFKQHPGAAQLRAIAIARADELASRSSLGLIGSWAEARRRVAAGKGQDAEIWAMTVLELENRIHAEWPNVSAAEGSIIN